MIFKLALIKNESCLGRMGVKVAGVGNILGFVYYLLWF